MAPAYSFFSFIKPAMAAGILTGIRVVPSNNLVTTKSTYDIFFTTATTGTIKTIEMNFGGDFNVSPAAKLIERVGIGGGALSASGSTLKYTVSNPVSISSGTEVRLEIGRIIAQTIGDSFQITVTTKNALGSIIDGPTLSTGFQNL